MNIKAVIHISQVSECSSRRPVSEGMDQTFRIEKGSTKGKLHKCNDVIFGEEQTQKQPQAKIQCYQA